MSWTTRRIRKTDEERKERNRLTARASRERRLAHLKRLEHDLSVANERVVEMHALMARMQELHDETDQRNQERIERLEQELFAMRAVHSD